MRQPRRPRWAQPCIGEQEGGWECLYQQGRGGLWNCGESKGMIDAKRDGVPTSKLMIQWTHATIHGSDHRQQP